MTDTEILTQAAFIMRNQGEHKAARSIEEVRDKVAATVDAAEKLIQSVAYGRALRDRRPAPIRSTQ
jgi:hypothetical protein